jgi:threonine dehydrogenase-like Zn-dependent dehydrogenase
MRAVTVFAGTDEPVRVQDVPEPDAAEGPVLVEVQSVGLCGTDSEVVSGEHGRPPPGEDHLVLGHESLGRVLEAPDGSGLSRGDLVVAIVRRPDPVPCPDCAVGEWDMCSNGRFSEYGIDGLHGFARERYRAEPEAVVRIEPSLGRLGVLLEPTSILSKAWEQVDLLGARTATAPERVLVTGAGPIGLLAAVLGVQRGLDVHVSDLADDGPKPDLVRALGATYHPEPAQDLDLEVDVVVECTGVVPVIAAALAATGRNGIVCLTGVTSPGKAVPVDLSGLNGDWVQTNTAVVGTVNANRRHYLQGAVALAAADRDWLSGLLTRTVAVEDFAEALDPQPDDIKTTLAFG